MRVWLAAHDATGREASPYEEMLRNLGKRHEKACLDGLGRPTMTESKTEEEWIDRTREAIHDGAEVIYQPALRASEKFEGTEVQIFGVPDFLVRSGDTYIVRDAKMARRISEKEHPEIVLQLQLYGWLFSKMAGKKPAALQVYNGGREICPVSDDGGAAAMRALKEVLAIKQALKPNYEPVGWSKCGPCEYRERCWKDAERAKDVSLLKHVDQGLARKFHELKILTPAALLKAFDARTLSDLKRSFGAGEKRVGVEAEKILWFAEAFESQRKKILVTPDIPDAASYVMFDLEGMPPHFDELENVYLWGAQVFGERAGEYRAAVAEFDEDGDRRNWFAFLEIVRDIFKEHGDIPFVHWADYERSHINTYIKRYGDLRSAGARLLANLVNLLKVTEVSMVIPVPSYSLKVIEQHVGYKRTQEEFGGQWSMAKFIEAAETRAADKRQQLMDEIVAYNKEDLEAMWAVFQWLRTKKAATGSERK